MSRGLGDVYKRQAVTGRLGMQDDSFSYVLAGGVFRGVPWLAQALTNRLCRIAPRSSVVRLEAEPAVGAVRLAIAEAEGNLVLPQYIA